MKTKFLVTISLVLLLICTILSSNVNASNMVEDTTDNTITTENYQTDYEYYYSDIFLYDEDISVNQVIDGNVFITGQDITISGTIYGDLFVFAGTLNIDSTSIIYGNIYAFASIINMAGATSDIYCFSNDFTLDNTGYTARNINVSANNVSLKGNIARDANITANSLTIDENVTIEGNLNYSSVNEFEINENIVGGEINYTKIEQSNTNIISSIIYSSISTLLFTFALIMLLLWLAPNFSQRAGDIIAKKSLLSLGIGILVFFGIIILAFILLIFTYGFAINIAIALIGLLLLAYAIAQTIFSIGMGKFICNKLNLNKNIYNVLFSLLIMLIIKLVSYAPYIGGIISFATSIIGLGMLFINSYKRKDLVNNESST